MTENKAFTRKQEATILFLLLVGSLLLYLGFFNDFVVPRSDFFAFHDKALSYLNFELPSHYKREPLYPALIALFSATFNSSTLFAAETINLVLAVINVALVYSISAFFLGRTGFFVALFFAINPSTVEMASQPILETLFLTGILATLLFSLKNQARGYLAAFLASLVRYEAVFLIPILVLKDFFIIKKRLRAVLLGLLSSIGIIAWMALSIFHHSGEVNPYISQLSLGIGEVRFLYNIPLTVFSFIPGFSLASFYFKLLVVISSILGLVGIFCLVRSSFSLVFTIMCFFIVYFVVHALYPSINAPLRYVWPILWIFYLFIFKGIQVLLSYIEENNAASLLNFRPLRFLVMFCVILSILVNFFVLKKIYDTERWFLILSFGLFSLALLAYFFYSLKENEFKYSSFLLLFFMAVDVLGIGLVEANSYLNYDRKYYRAQQREIGEWYGKVAKEGDVIAVSEPEVVRYFSGLKKDYFIALGELKGDTFSDFLSDLNKKGITYVVWDSHYSNIKEKGTRQRFGADLYAYFSAPLITNHFEVIKEINAEKWRSKEQKAMIFKVKND